MKTLFKKIIFTILKWEAILVLKRFKPRIIGVAGSVGKTSTKDAIYAALKDFVSVRKNKKSFNSDVGVPLTILGLETGWSSPSAWAKNVFLGLKPLFAKDYPEWLVLEMGTDRPGDMKKLVSWISLDYAVFTRFPDVPVHAEYFAKAQDVNDEDAQMMFGLKTEGVLVLNADDAKIAELAQKSTYKTMWYGFADSAHVHASNMEIGYDEEGVPLAQHVKVNFGSNSVPLSIDGALGMQHVYPVLAALVVAMEMGINALDVVESLRAHRVPPGRMNIVPGVGGITLIDDSYNSSPIALTLALVTMGELKADTKIAILGDMSELGKYTRHEHERIAHVLQEQHVDHLITLGDRASFIYDEAVKIGIKHAYKATSHDDAVQKALEWAKDNTAVLVKGSQSSRMEKVSFDLLYDKQRAEELLVRQDSYWKK
jgi:UDP-N-acetylmuramyl pentapeptide synthase